MPAEAGSQATSKSASKKKRKNKKSKAEKNANSNGDAVESKHDPEDDHDDVDGEADEDDVGPSRNASIVETSKEEHTAPVVNVEAPREEHLPSHNGTSDSAVEAETETEPEPELKSELEKEPEPEPESEPKAEPEPEPEAEAQPSQPIAAEKPATKETTDSDTLARLEAMAKDRDSLHAEVAELRKSLESIQGKHEEETTGLKEELEEVQSGKERAEEQYRNLLGKVNTIRSQLGERLKADAEELSLARTEIEKLQEQNRQLKFGHDEKDSTIEELNRRSKVHSDEVSELRSRSNLSTTNWVKERDDLNSQLAYAREEFESAKQAMQDWEVLAMEERSMRENYGERMSEMEDQLASLREVYERVASERDGQNLTVDGLQRALQEIQEERKRELREMVEKSQTQLDALRKQADEASQTAVRSATQLEVTQKELQRYVPFEKEVKEKNLLIGKLRHEAVILNDHLTKALRFLKRGKPEDNVDRQIVTNHFLHFLALDRTDPKKFQILQLIAALLGWTEEQREQAGLARPGASNAALRVPLSPFRRTPSTPGLNSDFAVSPTGGTSRESLAELWSDFLEREAQEGGNKDRRGSTSAYSQRSTSVTSPPPKQEIPGLGIRAASSGNMNPPAPPSS